MMGIPTAAVPTTTQVPTTAQASTTAPVTRRRDAARSRELLLQAGAELFESRGYDRTTTREIGERAGLDPALIARYFGGKAGLYIAVLRAEDSNDLPDLLEPGRVATLLGRLERRGPGPVFHAAVRRDDDPHVHEAAAAELRRRLVAPLLAALEHAGAPSARLRAELAVAAFAGIALGRVSGAFPELAAAPLEDVVALSLLAVTAVAGPDQPGDLPA